MREEARQMSFFFVCYVSPAIALWPSGFPRKWPYFLFANGLAASRMCSMKSCAAGLRVRFFRVMILVVPPVIESFTGKTLSNESVEPKCSADSWTTVRNRPVQQIVAYTAWGCRGGYTRSLAPECVEG